MGVLIQLITHKHITITIIITIMAIRTIILGLILAISTFVSCMKIPEDLYKTERKAFAMCDSDRMIGLTWKEVEKCEERFGDKLLEKGIPLPSEVDFDNADLNGDGTLLFEEWEKFVETPEDDDSSED